jgi:hypothetical protein
MRRVLYALIGVVVLVTAACAPAVPTIDPAQVQASAMAAASTMIAMTQAAIPTATEVPPTPIPSPTVLPPTLAPLPTVPSPTASGTTGDDCNHLFDLAATGNARTPVKINNLTKGPANISLGMFQKNAFGQCGYLSFSIPKGQSITASMPQTGPGPCWWGYAWINGPDPSTSEGGPFCWNSTDKYELDIGPDVIKITPP